MTALEEYENNHSWYHYGDGVYVRRIDSDYADAAIESLKCCGSCIGFYLCETEYRIDAGNRSCYFTPSRWKPRGG